MISATGIKRAIGTLSLMKFFPGDEDTRAALMELLGEICSSDEQVVWLAKRTTQLHPQWPGAHELRAVLCSKFKPRDGINADSDVYQDGIPSEKESRQMLEAAPMKALPAGASASVDPEAEKQITELATARAMPPVKRFRTITDDEARVDATLRNMYGEEKT